MLILPFPYSLRPMAVADIPAVLAVDRLSFPTPGTELLYTNELVNNTLAHYQVLVRHDAAGDQLAGHAGYWLIAGEIHVSTIAVHPEERGRGRGEWLLLNLLLESLAHDPILVTLEVRTSNEVARNLYRKYRFEEVGLRKRYYRDTNEDAILMTVDLATQPDYRLWLEERAEALAARASAD